MSANNWKFDYKSTPWDHLMNRTGDLERGVSKGHYRQPSEHRPKESVAKQLEWIDETINKIPSRYKSMSNIIRIKLSCLI